MEVPSAVLLSLVALSLCALDVCQGSRSRRQDILLSENDRCKTPRGQDGICKNIRQCPELLSLLRSRQPGSRDYLTKSTCGFQNRDPIVCCAEQGTRLNNRTTARPNATSSNRVNVPGLDVCGKSDVFHIRVVGGQAASLGGWPWMAALGYRSFRNPGPEWLCGGALVTDRHVITAGHCVQGIGDRTLYTVRLGDLDLDEDVDDGAQPVDVRVERIIPHPDYRSSEKVNDIAIVKLDRSFQFSSLLRPICLPTESQFRGLNLTNFAPYIAGWGAKEFRGPTSSQLQEVQIDVTDLPGCKQAFRNQAKAVIDNRVICAGETGKDACQGDSGGPLMLPLGKNNYYLIGVVSYGFKCAEPGYPGVYTNVYNFLDWILNNLN